MAVGTIFIGKYYFHQQLWRAVLSTISPFSLRASLRDVIYRASWKKQQEHPTKIQDLDGVHIAGKGRRSRNKGMNRVVIAPYQLFGIFIYWQGSQLDDVFPTYRSPLLRWDTLSERHHRLVGTGVYIGAVFVVKPPQSQRRRALEYGSSRSTGKTSYAVTVLYAAFCLWLTAASTMMKLPILWILFARDYDVIFYITVIFVITFIWRGMGFKQLQGVGFIILVLLLFSLLVAGIGRVSHMNIYNLEPLASLILE